MKKKVYSAVLISHIAFDQIVATHRCESVVVGIDVGKKELFAVLRWETGQFQRPWAVSNPSEIRDLVSVLMKLKQDRDLKVAMESTGTYGDALRQALADAGIELQLVSGKRAHDYAEVFDGVSSQHDGKDAAVVAELCALGKSCNWPWQTGTEQEQQIELIVDQMQAVTAQKKQWICRLEAMVARHWPELGGKLKLGRTTTLRILSQYGGPAALGADEHGGETLLSWAKGNLARRRVDEILVSAKQTMGMRQSSVDIGRMKWCAAEALEKQLQLRRYRQQLAKLAKDHPVLDRQGQAIGLPTACVLWRHLGDPKCYHCAGAYRKAMGLNLTERSSGMYQGDLKISKRGEGAVRRALHLAALRLIQKESGIKRWYERKLKTSGSNKLVVITALSRKLAVAMWSIVKHEQVFDIDRLLSIKGSDQTTKIDNSSTKGKRMKAAVR